MLKFYVNLTEIFKNKESLEGQNIEGTKGKIIQNYSYTNIYPYNDNECLNIISLNVKPKVIGSWVAEWVKYVDVNNQSIGLQTIYIPEFGRFQVPIIYATDFLNLINQTVEHIVFVDQTGTFYPNPLFDKKIKVIIEVRGSILIFNVKHLD